MATPAWTKIQAIIAAGNCRTCRQARGEDGTGQHCRRCADKHNSSRKIQERRFYICISCHEDRPLSAYRTVKRKDGPTRYPRCQRCELVARQAVARAAQRRRSNHK